MDLAWIALNHIHVTAELVYAYTIELLDDFCGVITFPALKSLCELNKMGMRVFLHVPLLVATIAFQAVDDTKSRITMCG